MVPSCLKQGANTYREYFNKEMFSHFPNNHSSDRIISSYFYPNFDSFQNAGVYLRESYKFPNNVIDTLISSLEASNFQKFKHDDPCNLIIELYYNHGLNSGMKCDNNSPFPNFWEEIVALGFKENKYLPDDFDLYIIEQDTGEYIPEKNLNNQKDLFGSNKWKNGISKGIAISQERRICIYWIEIW